MRTTSCLLSCYLVAILVGCAPSSAPKAEAAKPETTSEKPSRPEHEAELKWARDVAEGFLRAVGQDFKSNEALAWTTPQVRERHEKGSNIRYYGFRDFVITSTSMAPNGKEVIFRGTVAATTEGSWTPGTGGGHDPNFRGTVPFTLRVIENAKEGRWQVDSMQYEDPLQTSEGK